MNWITANYLLVKDPLAPKYQNIIRLDKMDGKKMTSAMISLISEYLYLFIIEYFSSNLLWTNSGSNPRATNNFNTNRRVDEITCRAWGRVPKVIMFYWYLIFWVGLMKIYYAFNYLLGRSYTNNPRELGRKQS